MLGDKTLKIFEESPTPLHLQLEFVDSGIARMARIETLRTRPGTIGPCYRWYFDSVPACEGLSELQATLTTVRASLQIYNNEADLERLTKALRAATMLSAM